MNSEVAKVSMVGTVTLPIYSPVEGSNSIFTNLSVHSLKDTVSYWSTQYSKMVPFEGNFTWVFQAPFHHEENSFLQSIPSFSPKQPPIDHTKAYTKMNSKFLTSYYNMGPKDLHKEITQDMGETCTINLASFLRWNKVSSTYLSNNIYKVFYISSFWISSLIHYLK